LERSHHTRGSLDLPIGVKLSCIALTAPQALAAKLSHVVLYALLIVMPLVGWAMLSAGGYPVALYGSLHLV
jgi:cytochrome b561